MYNRIAIHESKINYCKMANNFDLFTQPDTRQ